MLWYIGVCNIVKCYSLDGDDWRVSGGGVVVRVSPGVIGGMFIYDNVVLTNDSVRLQTEQHLPVRELVWRSNGV
jgi:hypothetical protein